MFKRGSRASGAVQGEDGDDVSRVPSADSATELTRSMISNASDTSNWEGDAKTCQICDAKLGKRYANPRHHCRICGRSVCGKCTPNQVQIESSKKTERACTSCIAILPKLPALTKSVADMHVRLGSLTGIAHSSVSLEDDQDLAAAIALCEAKLAPLERTVKELSAPPVAAAVSDAALSELEAKLKSTEAKVREATARAEKAEADLAEARKIRMADPGSKKCTDSCAVM